MMQKTLFTSTVEKAPNGDDRTLRFVSTSESIDRDGDIIEFDGWVLDNYRRNPVVLYGHDYRSLPVGKTVNIETDALKRQIIHDVKFAKKDEYEFADTVYRMAKAGYLNATSVGFIGLESKPRLDKDGHYLGVQFTKQELLELSIVPVPSNPVALQEAKMKGIITDAEILDLTELPEVDIICETDERKMYICDGKGEKIMRVKASDEFTAKVFAEIEEKTGAELSQKNKDRLASHVTSLRETAASLESMYAGDPAGGEGDDPKSSELETTKAEKPTDPIVPPGSKDEDIGLDEIQADDPDEIDITEGDLKDMIDSILTNKRKAGA